MNNDSDLLWECPKGHTWFSSWRALQKKGFICPECKEKNRCQKQYQRLKIIAESKGGKILSETYTAAMDKHTFLCGAGHKWDTLAMSILAGRWCPSCLITTREDICRSYLEVLFNSKFPKTRPDWMTSPITERKLELDGYSEELNLAFEHQGLHHYSAEASTPEAFERIKRNDALKIELCKKKGVTLIIIPELQRKLKIENLRDHIKNEILKLKPDILPKNFDDIKLDNIFPTLGHQLEELQKIAAEKGGECISTTYINSKVKLEWRCSRGHVWKSKPNTIKNGFWCPTCGGTGKKTIEHAQELAKERGGSCISLQYIDAKTDLEWKCDQNHLWMAPWSSVKRGSWCPECSKRRTRTSGIEAARSLARERGGECLSSEYKNCREPLVWKCINGHIWSTSYTAVQSGTWCIVCHREQRKLYRLEGLQVKLT